MRIVFATGGSGGHMFPALKTALVLRQRGHEVCFAGSLTLAQAKITQEGFACEHISCHGLNNRSLTGLCKFSYAMARGFFQSIRLIKRLSPDMVVGFGGYSSFPLILAGRLLGVRTMIHEQNVVPGKANRILMHLADRVAVSFKDSMSFFGNKSVWTGCPCHNEVPSRSKDEIRAALGLNTHQRTITLIGGSQGSQRLNEIFFEAMHTLAKSGTIQGVHVTGKKEFAHYQEKYSKTRLPVVVLEFISPVEDLYAVTDILVGRSGAATVSEIGAFAIPSVLVPYPFAGNHQKYNAFILTHAGAAIAIEQKNLTVNRLIDAIDQVFGLYFSREDIARKTKGLFVKDAPARLASAVEEAVKR